MSLTYKNAWLEIVVEVHPEGREAVSAFLFDLDEIRGRFSLVVANLILGELRKLADLFPPHVPAGGHLVLSGLLEDQLEAVSASFPPSLWQAPEVYHQGEWV